MVAVRRAAQAAGVSTARLGVAVAGLGPIGRLHARNLAGRVPGARLVRLVDPAERVGRDLATELGVPWSPSLDNALADDAVEAVVIATPSPLHAEMIGRVALSSRHVFCEKPISLDLAAGREALRAAEAAGVSVQVGFQRRFDPDWQRARGIVAAGGVGEVQLLRISHRNREHPHGGRTDRLGSLFVDMAVHDLDCARWLVGEVRVVRALATAGGESALIVLEFEDGALGVVDNMRNAGYGFECSAELVGTLSTLRIATGHRPSGVERLTPDGLTACLAADHLERHAVAYLAELTAFVDAVRTGRVAGATGADALAALELALAAERSAR
jgi:myo-inositol 2-dehydrogenase/D-chiro-inositol 1-dehydrogenase